MGAEMVRAEFADAESLTTVLKGVDVVFAMTTPFEEGVDAETAQGVALVDAAAAAGVDHFVFSSVASANKATGIPHFDSKYRVEERLVSSDLRWSVIAPVYFMSNLLFLDILNGLKEGTYAIALPPGLPLQQIATEDIGAFAAHVLANPDEFAGTRIDIAGDELSSQQSANVLAGILGRPISVVEVPIDSIRSFNEDLALMYEWFVTTGYTPQLTRDFVGLRSDGVCVPYKPRSAQCPAPVFAAALGRVAGPIDPCSSVSCRAPPSLPQSVPDSHWYRPHGTAESDRQLRLRRVA